MIISAYDFAPFPTVIDFERGGPVMTGPLSLVDAHGVTFTGDGALAGQPFMFGREFMSNLFGPGHYSDVGVYFPTYQEAVGAWVACVPSFTGECPASITATVYNVSHITVESATVPLTLQPTFIGFYSLHREIAGMEWSGGNAGFYGVDNITYGTREEYFPYYAAAVSVPAIPESGLVTLIMGGVFILLALRQIRS